MKKFTLLSTIAFCFILLLTVTTMFSCKKSTPDSTVTVNVSGNWKGSLTSTDHTDIDTVSMVIAQSGANFTAPISFSETDYSGSPATHKSYSGTLTGTVSGSNVAIVITVTGTDGGVANLTGTINTAGNTMSGTYGASGTGGGNLGSWSFTKN